MASSFFYGSFSFQSTGLFRDQGRFTTLQAEAYQANQRLAALLQQEVVDALKSGLVRPRVSTGRLAQVLAQPGNKIVRNEGFGVGIEDFLDDSQGKYYRQIDAGTDVHLGQKLYGVFSNQKRLKALDPYDGPGPAPRGATAFGAASGQEFYPMSPKAAANALVKRGMSRTQAKRRSQGVIRNAIEPEDFFRRAWDTFDAPAAIIREYDRAFRAAGFRVQFENGRLTKTPLRGVAAAGRRQVRGV